MSDEASKNSYDDSTHILPLNASDMIETIYDRFMAHFTPFGFQTAHEDVVYHPLPYKPEEDDELLMKAPYRLILELYSGEQRMLTGIDLYGDVVLGRGESRIGRIIVDLDPFGAQELGVSREHCMLRPTSSQLFAIDQGSTNGTIVNGVRSGRGVASTLNHEDLLRLGNLVLMVHILKRPSDAVTEPPKTESEKSDSDKAESDKSKTKEK